MAKAVYEAKDGTTYKSIGEAKARDRLTAAANRLNEAARAVEECLGETALTADGQSFDMSGPKTYWFLRAWDRPSLHEIWVWPHHVSVELDSREGMYVRWLETERRTYTEYRVDQLYASKEAAQKALIPAIEKRIAELQEAKSKAELSK